MTNLTERPKINFTILDGLRGLAATYVVVNHCRGFIQAGGAAMADKVPVEKWSMMTKLYYSGLQFTALGKEFVVFFFVLSGFSIAHSLSKNPAVLPFYKRRLIRLYPPYILALSYAALVFYLVSTMAPQMLDPSETSVFANFSAIIRNLLYIPTGNLINQFWSLSHEVIFYIIIPVLFFRSLKWYVIVSTLLYISGWIYHPNTLTGHDIITYYLFDYNFFFAVGITVYKNYKKISEQLNFSEWVMWLFFGTIVVISVAIKFKLGENNKITPVLFCILSIILLVNFLQKNITNQVFQFLGNLSYTIYISHIASIYVFILLMNKFGWMNGRTTFNGYIWPVAALFCILLSIPFYLLAEKPTKKWLSKLR